VTKEDKEAGVAVVDIGGTLTDITAYRNGKMVFTASLPVGGATFTQDLAVGLRTPQAAAERIKKAHGAALVDVVSTGEIVEVESLKNEGPRIVEARFICEILEARAEETLGLILKKLNDEDLLFTLKSGVVLTGGGSMLPGLPELGEFTFDVKLRRGTSRDVLSANPLAQGPVMSTAIGLLQYARNTQSFETSELSLDTFKNTWGKFRNFIENIL
jgi:cell division protein FtsA